MFTGIIEELGTVESVERRRSGSRLRVRCRAALADITEGASISVNGVCLTAVDLKPDSFGADVAPETLRRSNLGELKPGSLVNLERPLSPSSRLGGHIVQGHIDATAEIVFLEELGDGNWWLTVRVPPEIDRYLVFKGSVAIDGISLTVARLEDGLLSVTIIPHTYESTALSARGPGDRVNVECDVLAKYVEKMLAGIERPGGLTMEKLREMGY